MEDEIMDPECNSNEMESAAELPAPAEAAPETSEETAAAAAAVRAKELKRRIVKYSLFGAVFLVMAVVTAGAGDVITTIFAAVMTLLCGLSVWKVIRKMKKEV